MFKEMTTKKKMIIAGIVLVILIAIFFIVKHKRKKKKESELAADNKNIVSQEPVEPAQRRPKSQIIPEEDIQVHKSTAEAPISVKEAIPETNVQAPATQQKAPVATPAKQQQQAGPYKSALGDEFMQNANIGG